MQRKSGESGGGTAGVPADTVHTATKAGLFCRWQTANSNANGLGRWDNFTIGATP